MRSSDRSSVIGQIPAPTWQQTQQATYCSKKTWEGKKIRDNRGRVRPPRRPQLNRQPGFFSQISRGGFSRE